jgi:hypothetical protein
MDDFLHNLRSGNLKAPDRNRRQYNDSQYKGPQRRNIPDRRKREQENPAQMESLQAIKEILKSMLENQKSMTEAIEIRNRTEIQKANAIDKIAAMLEALLPQAIAPALKEAVVQSQDASLIQPEADSQAESTVLVEPESAAPVAESIEPAEAPADAPKPTLKDASAIICRMRKEGLSYAKIAEHLESEGIPTVSGKGQWRGQSVQRVYQKAVD